VPGFLSQVAIALQVQDSASVAVFVKDMCKSPSPVGFSSAGVSQSKPDHVCVNSDS
jgi:hypothetical protein